MILDSLNHIENYKGLGNVYKALEFLKSTDFLKMEIGRYELNDDIYYMIQEYECKQREVGEAHKKYIDVQYIFEGEEIMTVASIDCEKKLVEENPEKDVWFYSCESNPFLLEKGFFAVYFPNDIHMATVVPNKKTSVKKVVVKVRV